MADPTTIDELFHAWQRDQHASPEDICKNHPELLPALKSLIKQAQTQFQDANAFAVTPMAPLDAPAPPSIPSLTPLHSPLPFPSPPATRPASFFENHPGDKIGVYTLREFLGRGGFGEVWLADRVDPYRKVAIKFVLPHRVDANSVARFQLERQALASLDHPGIAKIFDAGVTIFGAPYAVMEYVPGVRLNKYCDREKLTINARLQLFCQICDAVHHAHQNGFIHRDLSPDNILVMMENDRPRARIIDFGIAKVVNRNIALSSGMPSDDLHMMLGKPEYMAPEQAESTQVGIDTRADIFSLGVILYELLTGVLPLPTDQLRKRAVDAVLEVIRQERTEPSTRFTRLDPKSRESASAVRGEISPNHLARKLRGRLRHIPMTAMRIDRTKRFSSAAAMATDLRNYLENKDFVEAAAEPWWDRFQRNAVRHRVAVSIAASLLVLLVSATVVFGVLRQEAAQQRDIATRALGGERTARAVSDQARADLTQQEGHTAAALHAAQERLVTSTSFQASYLAESGRPAEARQLLDDALPLVAQTTLSPLWISAPLLGLNERFDQPLSDPAAFGPLHEPVRSVTFLPDRRRALSAGDDNALTLWDIRTGRALQSWPTGQTLGISGLALSPDGGLALSAGFDHSVKLWDLATAREVRPFTGGHSGPVNSAAFSPDGRLAVTSGQDNSAIIWDVAAGHPLRTLSGHGDHIWNAAFSPDGTRILCAEQTGNAVLWNVADGAEVVTFRGGSALTSAGFTPDGRRALAGCVDGSIKIWDLATRQALPSLTGHDGEVWSLAVSADGRMLASASADKTVKIWDLASAKELRTLYGHAGRVNSVAFSTDSALLLSGGEDRTIKLWSVQQHHEVSTLLGHMGVVEVVALSPDGRMALSGGRDKTVRLWDRATGMELAATSLADPVGAAGFSSDGIVVADAHRIMVWDPQAAKEIRSFDTGEILAFSPDAAVALSVTDNHTLSLWNVATGGLIRTLGVPREPGDPPSIARPVRAAFSRDGAVAVSGSLDGAVFVWDLKTGQPRRASPGHTSTIDALCLSPDARSALSASNESPYLLHWDVNSGALIQSLHGYSQPILGATFSPDGRVALAGGADGTLKLWDLTTGNLTCTLGVIGSGTGGGKDALDGVTSVAFSADGGLAISGTQNHRIHIWDFSRPARQHEYASRLSQARAVLDKQPADPAAEEAFGQWYALRRADAWAIDFLGHARQDGAPVSPLLLAQCYVRLHQYPQALPLYQEALRTHEAPERYLLLCIAALQRAGPAALPRNPPNP